MDLYQSQRGQATTNAYDTNAGMNVNRPGAAVVAMPVVREQGPPRPDGATAFLEPVPSVQQAAKRTRDGESGDAGPAYKRLCTASAPGATQAATLPLPSGIGLLSMPDDVMLQIVAAPDTAEPVSAVRDLQRFRASCKELRQRVTEPPLELVRNLKYRRSAAEIRAVAMDGTVAAQQVETQVRTLCERYGDVRVVLSKLTQFMPDSPHMRYRNHSVLAGIAASKDMCSLRLDLDGARDIRIKALCDALQHKAPTKVALTARKMDWGNVALAKLFGTAGQSESIISLAIACSGGRGSSSFRFREQGGWAPKTAQCLGSMLRTNRRLELPDLSGVYPGDVTMETIAQALAADCTLNHLRLTGNGLSEKSIRALGQALRGNVVLATLNLDGNSIGLDGVQGLLAGLQKNRTLTALSLSRCLPGDAVALELFTLFDHNDTLRRLDLGHGAITGPVAACLARSLQAGQHLVSLALPGNPIGSEGALAIGDLLASDTMLTSLDLSDCSIGDDGLIGLAQGLSRNTVLRHLNLALNRDLTAAGIRALAGALKAHPRIASLRLCKLCIDLVSAQALAQGLLANHPALESLELSGCEIGLEATRSLVGATQVNTRLKNLVMDKPAHRTDRSGGNRI